MHQPNRATVLELTSLYAPEIEIFGLMGTAVFAFLSGFTAWALIGCIAFGTILSFGAGARDYWNHTIFPLYHAAMVSFAVICGTAAICIGYVFIHGGDLVNNFFGLCICFLLGLIVGLLTYPLTLAMALIAFVLWFGTLTCETVQVEQQ